MRRETAAFRISVPAAFEDAASAALWEQGTDGIEVQDAVHGRSALLAYFSNGTTLSRLQAALPVEIEATVEAAPVPKVDWVARFREGFQPFTAGGFLIAPCWAVPPGRTPVLVVDPGQAFGTGTHESTRLCLAALEELAARRPLGRVLDVGAGSGILSVAAAKLGATPVIALDLDPVGVESIIRHAGLNQVTLHSVRGDGGRPFRAACFDLVLANLTAPLLVEKRLELSRLVAPAGRLVLSGFLQDEASAIRSAYETFGRLDLRAEGEWASALVDSPS